MTRIALVVLDTLRKDAFNEFFAWLPGQRFERAFATANWTSPAHASLFTGQYPSEAGVHAKSPSLDVDGRVLAERISDAGYQTRCWSANPNISPHRQWDRGFEEFIGASALKADTADTVDWTSFTHDNSSLISRVAKYPQAVLKCLSPEYDTVASFRQGALYARGGNGAIKDVPDDGASSILKRLRKMTFEKDEFLYLNLMEAHTPYYTPADYDGPDWENAITVSIKDSLGLKTPQAGTKAAYFDVCQYLASVYREIFDELIDSFDYVITMADHGEMLGESGIWNHTYGLFPEVTHVPLVISGDEVGQQTDIVVNHLDVHRTILDLASVEGPSRGRNLLTIEKGQSVLAEYHGLIPIARQRLEEEQVSKEVLETHDTRSYGVAIPPNYYQCETRNGYLKQGTAAENPDAVLKQLKNSISERSVKEIEPNPSKEVNERLNDLGYI